MRGSKFTVLVMFILMAAIVMSGCGAKNQENSAGTNGASSPAQSANGGANAAVEQETPTGQEEQAGEETTRTYTDDIGRSIKIPNHPQKIVYVGSDPGDLLALGVKPFGASLSVIGTQVAYPDLLEGIEDIGYPANIEKVLAIGPDLILFSDWDEKALDPLAKIAPTVVMGGNGTFERMDQFADLLGKQTEAGAYKASYEAKAEKAKEALRSKVQPDKSATVLLQLGKDLYVMGHQGLSVSLYDMLGLQPAANVQKLIDKDERFSLISQEVMPDYVGDELYILTDETEETTKATNALLASRIWSTLPAVKNGHVYVMNSRWNYDDPVTRERLLDELGKVMEPQ